MKFSQEQLDDSILDRNIVMNKIKEEIIISEYTKSEKNIQPIWVGEGWYKSVPNSFNYFAAGFEAGMNYVKEKK
jgi:hypothetical protein